MLKYFDRGAPTENNLDISLKLLREDLEYLLNQPEENDIFYEKRMQILEILEILRKNNEEKFDMILQGFEEMYSQLKEREINYQKNAWALKRESDRNALSLIEYILTGQNLNFDTDYFIGINHADIYIP